MFTTLLRIRLLFVAAVVAGVHVAAAHIAVVHIVFEMLPGRLIGRHITWPGHGGLDVKKDSDYEKQYFHNGDKLTRTPCQFKRKITLQFRTRVPRLVPFCALSTSLNAGFSRPRDLCQIHASVSINFFGIHDF